MSLAELYLGPSRDDSDAVEPAYHVRLPVFDGPMELLLHLIRKNEVDIYDIPIADITRQYLGILELMEELHLSLAGDFLVLAATLIHIKSKMLLPPPHEDGTEDDPTEDPRAELVARLLEYEQYKEAAQQLHQQEELRSATFVRPEQGPSSNGHENGRGEMIEVDLFELINAFRDVLERVRQRAELVYERETVSVEQMIGRLSRRLAPGDQCTFVDLFDDASNRATVIVTFLAVLEMVRLRLLRTYQRKPFGTIYVLRLPEEARVQYR